VTVILGVLSCIYYSEENKTSRPYIPDFDQHYVETDTIIDTGSLIEIPVEGLSFGVISNFSTNISTDFLFRGAKKQMFFEILSNASLSNGVLQEKPITRKCLEDFI